MMVYACARFWVKSVVKKAVPSKLLMQAGYSSMNPFFSNRFFKSKI